MDIGKRIRDLREERGLTQREVARRAGLTPSGVGFIEHGQTRNPSAETVVAIARALGVPVKDLLEEPVPLGEASETGPASPQFEDEQIFMISYVDGTYTWDEAWAEARERAKEAHGEYGSKVTVRDNGEAVEVFVERGVADRMSAAYDRAVRDEVRRANARDEERAKERRRV